MSIFNCKVIEAIPVQIVRHWLSDGSLLMTTLYYSVGGRNRPNHIRIDQYLLDKYLEIYNHRLVKEKGCYTWHIHSKKQL